MKKWTLLLGFWLLSSCSHVTTLRTAELKNVETNLKVRIDSLTLVIDSLSREQQAQNRRIQADLRLLLSALAEGNEKLEARLEEHQYLLDRISQEKNARPQVRMSPALQQSAVTPAPVEPVETAGEFPVDTTSGAAFDLELEQMYSQAKSDFNADQFKEAFVGFKSVYEKDPIGKLAENSLFWMANSYGKTGQGPKAIKVLQRMINEFPQGAKLCSGHFQIGKIYGEMGEEEQKTEAWKGLIAEKQCAGTNEVFRAQEQLKVQ